MELPFVDEHCVAVEASSEATWTALLTVPNGFTGPSKKLFARAVGCTDLAESGPRPLEAGSSFPGFHVVEASPPTLLLLEGQHRFSRYALNFRIEETSPGLSRICAETRAEFPHLHGAVYRSLVIGTRFHVVAVRNILRTIKRRAEAVGAGVG